MLFYVPAKYYELARAAHHFDLIPGVRSYPRLRNRRESELKRIYRDRGQNKSHRTVIAMTDPYTAQVLCEARDEILKPLDYTCDETTSGTWLPKESILDPQDLHVTIAIPWWWHTIREGNRQLSQELVARFRQGLLTEQHHAFQIELERFVLLGGKTLVALWRTVGSRETSNNFLIFDRHGDGQGMCLATFFCCYVLSHPTRLTCALILPIALNRSNGKTST